jgi:E3 ubiquitin-protein ligase BRE1
MDGRKRVDEMICLPKKKQYAQEYNLVVQNNGEDTEIPEELLEFEKMAKEAIWRQCRNYKRQLDDRMAEIIDLEEKLGQIRMEQIRIELKKGEFNKEEIDLMIENENQKYLVDKYREELEELRYKYYESMKKIEKLNSKENQEIFKVNVVGDLEYEGMKEKLIKMELELDSITEMNKSRMEELEVLKNENIGLKCELNEMKNRYYGFPDDFRPYIDYYESSKHYKNEIRGLKEILDEKKLEIDNRQKIHEMEGIEWIGEMDKIRESCNQIVSNMKEQMEQMMDEKSNMEREMKQMVVRLEDLVCLNKERQKYMENMKQRDGTIIKDNEMLKNRCIELSTALGSMENRSEEMEKDIRELLRHLKDDETLLQEIDSIATAFESSQMQNDELLKQIVIKDDNYIKLYSERTRYEMQIKEMNSRLESREVDVRVVTKGIVSDNCEQMMKARISNMEKELLQRQNVIDGLKRKSLEYEHNFPTLERELTHFKQKSVYLQEKFQEKTALSDQTVFEKDRMKEELKRIKHILDSITGSGKDRNKDQEELEAYKQLLRCNTCNLRHKSVALNRCMHVFCKECIDKRLETRQRKCPICTEPFGTNDVRQIFL